MNENGTIEFECLACGAIVCVSCDENLIEKIAYLMANKCPGCKTQRVAWKLADAYEEGDGRPVLDNYVN